MLIRIAILATTIGCAGPAAPRAAEPPAEHAEALQAPAGLRLPRTFVPTAYSARLALAPSEPRFRGHIEIDGELASPSRVIWLHAQGLTFDAAVATTPAGRTSLEALALPGGVVAFRAPRALAAGRVALTIDYRGATSDDAPDGVFRQQHAGAWYAYTQFEATSARRAFPCFDEPDVKVPWKLTLDVPAGMLALSNAPAASDTVSAGRATHTVAFAQTRPLPSYLIAFAVGTFDVFAAPPTRRGTPVRIVVPHGPAAAAAAGARDDTGPLIAQLEDYFGSPYPYDKLDLVAVPTFPGAMENAGLITFSQNLLLEAPEQATIAHRRMFANVAAHELAHQWFGDMVTMAWWDDVWLNEAFATWIATKIVDQWQPRWGGAFEMIDQKASAMASDQLAMARKIREPIADLVLSGAVGLFDAWQAFSSDTHTPAQRRAIYEAFKAHYDAVSALLPTLLVPKLSVIGFVLCDPALRDDVVQFFRGRLRDEPQVLAQGIERMDTCLARRRAAHASVAAFLARY